MILPTEYCARIIKEVDHIINSPDIWQYYETYKQLLSSIQEHADISVPKNNIAQIIDTINQVYDWLRIQVRNETLHHLCIYCVLSVNFILIYCRNRSVCRCQIGLKISIPFSSKVCGTLNRKCSILTYYV